ncbi:MAG: formimidoylglutamate deiminase [Burkholderiales bacterium]|nr:formimidoylglutamate deiminase [Burkholderiales bacterium]
MGERSDPSGMLWAPRAWLVDPGTRRGGWHRHVALRIGADGRWAEVAPGIAEPPRGATVLDGAVLPGLVDAHSHAFQRAFAGLAERRESDADDFWSWRDRMYRVALRVTPEQLRAVAAQLYVELLMGGYTQVCEFHYLQRREDGTPYDDPLALAWAVADAVADAGIGATILPVLYERAGFAQPALRDVQRRFRAHAGDVWHAARRIAAAGRPLVGAGVAVHSLRAAAPESIAELRGLADGWAGPIHIHVAEQVAEVDECVRATGARPIEWLARERLLDARWQLVHATHATRDEIASVAASGATVVICPTTEGNLGDGTADLPGWLDAGVPIAIGSDSQVGRDWREELRWLDYGQRLVLRRRNVAAAPSAGEPSTAARLFEHAVRAGALAAGEPQWGLREGARADLLVADPGDPALAGIPAPRVLDAIVFSGPARPWRDVMVAGRWVIRDHVHPRGEAIMARFAEAMSALWPDS